MMSKVSPLNPSKKVYAQNKPVTKGNVPFIITKGPLSGKVLARGNNAQIVDGQILFPPNLKLDKYIGKKVTVAFGWNDDDNFNFLTYEYER